MKKTFRILASIFFILVGILLAIWLVLQSPDVQTWLAQQAAARLSKSLGTRVSIKRVDIGFLNRVNLRGLTVLDKKKDTLVHVGNLQVNATDWFFAQDSIELKYARLEDVRVRLRRDTPEWNYAFLVDYFSSGKKEKNKKDTSRAKPIKLSLEKVEISNLRFLQADNWKGYAMLAGVKSLELQANRMDFAAAIFDIDELNMVGAEFRELRKSGLWSKEDSIANRRRLDSLYRLKTYPENWNPSGMQLVVRKLNLKDGLVEIYNRRNRPFVRGEFDERDIIINQINGSFKNLLLDHDTVTANVTLSARERSGVNVKKMDTRFRMHPQLMEFANLDLQLNDSRLGPYYAMRYRSLDEMSNFIDSVRIDARMLNSTVSIADIAFFAPELKGIQQIATLTGTASGTISNFVVNGLELKTGRSRLAGTYSMKGLVDVENTWIEFKTPGSVIDLKDVSVWAPQLKNLKHTPADNVGLIRYQGNFSGTYQDFTAKGHIASDVGELDAELAMYLGDRKKGKDAYNGKVRNARINAGKLLGIANMGVVKFDGNVHGLTLANTTPMMFAGSISSAEYNGYTYRELGVEGQFSNQGLKADISANDPNLNANFSTVLDFRDRKERYNARGVVGYADLHALNLVKDSIRVAGLFDADFRGNKIDDFLGYARIYDAEIKDNVQQVNIDSLVVQAEVNELGVKTLTLQTNEADARITGNFNLRNLPDGFQQFLHSYYPSVIDMPRRATRDQQLSFSINTKDVEPLLHFVNPRIKGLNNSTIVGSLNTANSELLVNLDVPYFSYDGASLSNTRVQASGSANQLSLRGDIGNLQLADSLSFPGATIAVSTKSDSTALRITTRGDGVVGDAVINGNFYSKPGGFEMDFEESSFVVNQKKWVLSSEGKIEMKSGYLIADGVELKSDEQRIRAYTHPSDEGNWNDLMVSIESFNFGGLLPFLLKEPRLEGIANGNAVIQDPLGKVKVTSDIKLSQFFFNNDSVGEVSLTAGYDALSKKLNATVDSRNPLYDFSGEVNLHLVDSVENQIDTHVKLRNERVSVLAPYLTSVFDNIDGFANGEIDMRGKLSSPLIIGKVTLNGGSVKVGYNQCTYFIDSAQLEFGDGFLDFGTINIKDVAGRKAVVRGIMKHKFFDNMSFNMSMSTDSLQVLNTSAKDNDLFYGDAVAKATMDISGPLNDMDIRITGEPTDSSHIVIANKTSKESGVADFIVFKSYGREMEESIDTSVSNMHLKLDLTANSLCQIDVIIDEISGDIIRATGSGNLKIETGTLEPTTMRGRYLVEKGSYSYSFQTVIRKPFELLGGEKSYIEWNGDPYEANLNIAAQYTARSVSMRDLMSSEQGQTILDQSAQNYKGDVYVIAYLRGRLSSPDISFGIEFPQGSPMKNNISAQEMLRQIEADNSEMLRQVTYLIVFRSFAPYKQGVSGRNPGADLAVNTLSDLLSSQMGKILTNVVQDITGDRSLNVDITTDFYSSAELVGGTVSTASGYDRVNFNFMLNKSYFNNRVVVNLGSDFDVAVSGSSTTGFQFLPDVSVEFILTSNRRLRAIIFKKDNLDYAGRLNRQGISFSYRKEYDKFVSAKKEEAFIFIRKDEK